ncbi:MAG: conjugal transfer protein TraN, partial [Burkholderiaceae bacterium]
MEGPETRDIAGAQVFKECWRYTHKFECVEESVHDTCAPLKTATGCLQTGSVCKTRAFNGECLVFTNTFTCDAKQQPLPEGILQVGESFTLVKDEIVADQCQELKTNPKCQKTTSVCTDPGGTRIINGQPITKDCWAWEETYACVTMQSDCRDLSENSACKLVHQNCESPNPDGTCALKALTYSCATGASGPTEVTTCNGGKFCLNGLCFDQPAGNDKDFAMAMTMMEAGRQAAGYAQGQDLVKFFTGEAKDCSKTTFANCCRTNTKGAGMNNGAMISTVMQAGRQAWGSWYVYDSMMGSVRSTNALGALYSRFASAEGSWSNFATGDFFSGFSYYGVTFNPLAAGGQFFSFDPTSFAIAIAIQVLSELLSCDQEEEVLAMQRGQNLCAYVGSY